MASLASLMKGGSFTPLPGGGFDFKLDMPKSKFRLDDKRFKRLVGEARARSLRKVGLVVKDRTKRQMSSRAPRQRPKQVRIGSRFGMELIARIERVPKSDVVTSWRTSRNPRGMLRSDIQSDYDTRSKSVVVGPAKFPRLNDLIERGGTAIRYFKPLPIRTRGNRVLGILTNTPPATKRWFTDSRRRVRTKMVADVNPFSFRIRIKPRAYMAKGIAKARPRIPEQFRDQIRGP
jgi:hypothetical protein